MIKLSLALASTFLTTSAYSQVRIIPTSASLAWSGPVAGALSMIPSDRTRLSPSLPRLAAPGADGLMPFLTSPELLNPLTASLEALGATPAEFGSMPQESKLALLSLTAGAAEERMKIGARNLAAGSRSPELNEERAAALTTALGEARALGVYLDRDGQGLLRAAERGLAAHRAAKTSVTRIINEDLGSK